MISTSLVLMLALTGPGLQDPTPARLKALERSHGVRILRAERPMQLTVTYPDGRVAAQVVFGRASGQAAADYRGILLEEIPRYPPEILEAIGLRTIWLCGGLSFRDGKKAGERAGLVLAGTEYLFLDVSSGLDSRRIAAYARRKGLDYLKFVSRNDLIRSDFHHEVFHLIDVAVHRGAPDSNWLALSGGLEAYQPLSGGKLSSGIDVSLNVPGYSRWAPGFVTRYAQTDPSEDKAELYGWTMANPSRMRRFLQEDPILRAKFQALKEEIAVLKRRIAQSESVTPEQTPIGR